MVHTNTPVASASKLRAALRHVLSGAPGARAVADGGSTLERMAGEMEPPRLVDAQCVEDATLRARLVKGAPVGGFAAFLDGRQESRIVGHDGIAPVVRGIVSAAVRVRHERRLSTWSAPLRLERLYVPLRYAASADRWRASLGEDELVDTGAPDARGDFPGPHPMVLTERARNAVSRHREELERELAERWCASEHRALFIDGGIGGSDIVAGAACTVGVVKSHRTMYLDQAGLHVVLNLRRGERTSAICIAPRDRSSVLSWYLRLRAPDGPDALWGVVRVEVAVTDDPTRRADEVSRWVLAEGVPLAAPDPRWDRMAYGIRNVEEYLRAIG